MSFSSSPPPPVFTSRFLFLLLSECARRFLRVYVSGQARLIAVPRLDNDARAREKREGGGDARKPEKERERESRSPSLIIIIARPFACLALTSLLNSSFFLTTNMRRIVNARTISLSRLAA